VPLIEIVSEPDLGSSPEAAEYLRKLRDILRYLEICDGNMEEGSFRCDANISMRPVGSEALGVKTELKNMNSFRNVQRALEFEMRRQQALLQRGDRIVQETRLWDNDRGVTVSMRGKEEAHDYRYFPDPDLVPLVIDSEWIERVALSLPELPDAKRQRFAEAYQLPPYDAQVLTASRDLADYFETVVKEFPEPKVVSNWIMSELMRELNRDEKDISACPVPPANLAELLKLMKTGVISGKIAKTVFQQMYGTGQSAKTIVEEKGLLQVTDASAIESVIEEVLQANPSEVEQYRGGKQKLLGYFVGEVMKKTRGKANPQLVNEILRGKLG
jgi:aspartyl-tRNA(Asn)/glutamyl-tRNA(Gln) amidotransferase subunit B